jgi:hypothetical protein
MPDGTKLREFPGVSDSAALNMRRTAESCLKFAAIVRWIARRSPSGVRKGTSASEGAGG